MIAAGDLGRIFHYRARYLQDWIIDPEFPLVWRLQGKIAGSGTHGDINAHIIDLGRYLVGELSEVCGHLETFIKERPLPGTKGEEGPGDGGRRGHHAGQDSRTARWLPGGEPLRRWAGRTTSRSRSTAARARSSSTSRT